jgi:hypothetical protein
MKLIGISSARMWREVLNVWSEYFRDHFLRISFCKMQIFISGMCMFHTFIPNVWPHYHNLKRNSSNAGSYGISQVEICTRIMYGSIIMEIAIFHKTPRKNVSQNCFKSQTTRYSNHSKELSCARI